MRVYKEQINDYYSRKDLGDHILSAFEQAEKQKTL